MQPGSRLETQDQDNERMPRSLQLTHLFARHILRYEMASKVNTKAEWHLGLVLGPACKKHMRRCRIITDILKRKRQKFGSHLIPPHASAIGGAPPRKVDTAFGIFEFHSEIAQSSENMQKWCQICVFTHGGISMQIRH